MGENNIMTKDHTMHEALSPESVGISSQALLRFLNRLEEERIAMHGFLVVRHGLITAEGYWPPFSKDRLHRMYSVSKSFVSLAVGCMIDEGKLSLTDAVADYFPDKIPCDVHPYIACSTVRDLLMMATPYSEISYGPHDSDWVWTFFNKTPSHLPGTIFYYDTAATVVLGTIVERLSGMPFLEYLRPRLLDPIGFSQDTWCVRTPEGTSWGGSGVQCTLRDMAKVALVCMNHGRWDGRQLISSEYINAATSRQIDNSPLHGNHGYGYQIWMEKDNGFSFRGMGSQLAYCWPDKGFLFACIADTQGEGPTGIGVIEAMHRELYDYLSDDSLPEDPEGMALLGNRIAGLQWALPQGEISSPWVNRVSGVHYTMNDNPMGITDMAFTLQENEGIWEYTNAQGHNFLKFGIGKYIPDQFPQKNYYGAQIGTIPGICYKCMASAAWAEEHKLNFIIYITDDYFGTLKMTVAFRDDEIAVWMSKVAEWFLDEYEGFAGGRAV